MRAHLRTLTELGAVERCRQNDFPGSVDYKLARPGRELMSVAVMVRTWLGMAPDGPIDLGTSTAKSTIKALVEGWSTSMLRALAARPLSLTELDSLITGVSYPSLERRLVAMRLTGQVTRMRGHGRRTPYAVTDWLRQAVAPLVAAARWEGAYASGTAAPVTNRDVEAAFMLSLPLLRLPAEMSGSCRFAVEFPNGNGQRLAGALIGVEDGRVASCVSRLEGKAGAWASGSTGEWMSAVIEQDAAHLEIGGDCLLASAAIKDLHGALFGVRAN